MSNTSEANIILVGPVTPHPNADKLELTQVGGYQMVVGKGQFKEGDLAVFVQPDCVVPQTEPFRFIWGSYAEADPNMEPKPSSCQSPGVVSSLVASARNGARVC